MGGGWIRDWKSLQVLCSSVVFVDQFDVINVPNIVVQRYVP